MTLRLLGTGGADGIPALFGNDPVSAWARKHGGPDIRTRTAAVVDLGLKIDLPPETGAQLARDGLSARDWDVLLITHSDDDHLDLAQLQYALYPFTEEMALPFPIFANDTVLEAIRERYPDWPMDLVSLRPFEAFESAGYRITPLLARHTPSEECLNFLIEREGRRIVYATDTGIWPEETFACMAGIAIDLLVVECTNALCDSPYEGHLNLHTLGEMLRRLREIGVLDAETRVVTTHHAAAGCARHGDLLDALAPLGAAPGFDGMLVDVGSAR